MTLAVVMGLLGVVVAGLLWQSAGAARARKARRAGYLDDCRALFSKELKAVVETGFPRLSGRYRGQTFDIQVVPDSLSLRKLPVLWLLVTLPEPLPVRGTFDVMLRATGLETFSNFGSLPEQIAAPPGFPPDCTVRTNAPDAVPGPALIARYLAGLDRARLKEVVVAPAGIRLVWLVGEADRGRYLLFRDAEMGAGPLSPAVLQPLMDGLCDLWAAMRSDLAPPLREVG